MTLTRPTAAPMDGPCPTFYVALCQEAAEGEGSYANAAGQLVRHLGTLAPDRLTLDVWARRLATLSGLVHARDDARVLAWFDRQLPRCMALVSEGGRRNFLAGVYRTALDEGRDVFTV